MKSIIKRRVEFGDGHRDAFRAIYGVELPAEKDELKKVGERLSVEESLELERLLLRARILDEPTPPVRAEDVVGPYLERVEAAARHLDGLGATARRGHELFVEHVRTQNRIPSEAERAAILSGARAGAISLEDPAIGVPLAAAAPHRVSSRGNVYYRPAWLGGDEARLEALVEKAAGLPEGDLAKRRQMTALRGEIEREILSPPLQRKPLLAPGTITMGPLVMDDLDAGAIFLEDFFLLAAVCSVIERRQGRAGATFDGDSVTARWPVWPTSWRHEVLSLVLPTVWDRRHPLQRLARKKWLVVENGGGNEMVTLRYGPRMYQSLEGRRPKGVAENPRRSFFGREKASA